MKHAHKVDRRYAVSTAVESMQPGYLAKRFEALRRKQKAAAKPKTDAVVRKLREPKVVSR